jgi:hypothetical protein
MNEIREIEHVSPDGRILRLSMIVNSTEADHGLYTEIPATHQLNRITDQHPTIRIPENVKKIKNIKSFNDENELYRYVDKRIASLLKGPNKKLHREIPPIMASLDGGRQVEINHIHECNVNQNERICYTIFFNLKYNKIVILVAWYFAHNTGIKSPSGGYKKNPSEEEFIMMLHNKSMCSIS